jgi:peptide/nickel transport system permease protein
MICLFAISIIVFFLVHLSGDPTYLLLGQNATPEDVARVEKLLGLDQPLYVQYWHFISNAVQGDLGESIQFNRPTIDVYIERFPYTIVLGVAALVWSIILGVPIGILSSVKVRTWFDSFGKIFSLLGQALPVFWLGILLVMVFSIHFKLVPAAGTGGFVSLILPSFTLGYSMSAFFTRLTRSTMLDVLDSEYIKMARIKGVSEFMVIMKHAFKNAFIPVMTMGAMNLAILLNGPFWWNKFSTGPESVV